MLMLSFYFSCYPGQPAVWWWRRGCWLLRCPCPVLRRPCWGLRCPCWDLRCPCWVLRRPSGELRSPRRLLRSPRRVLRGARPVRSRRPVLLRPRPRLRARAGDLRSPRPGLLWCPSGCPRRLLRIPGLPSQILPVNNNNTFRTRWLLVIFWRMFSFAGILATINFVLRLSYCLSALVPVFGNFDRIIRIVTARWPNNRILPG